ncbi:MAG: hypothetical protein RL154_509, partial [Pseudomonadota bacterium]
IKSIVALIRKKNIRAFIAHINLSLADIAGNNKTGIDDGLYGLEVQKLDSRVQTWIEAAKFRELDKHGEDAHKNVFGANVLSRKVRFYFNQNNSLNLILDYFRNDKRFDTLWYSQIWADACYDICKKILSISEINEKPVASFEENEEYFFFTISKINSDNKTYYEALSDAIAPEYLGVIGSTYSKSNHIFSLYAKKIQQNIIQINKQKTKNKEATQIKVEQNINTILKRSTAIKQNSAIEYIASIDLDKDEIRELEELEKDTTFDLIDISNEEHGLEIFIKFFDSYAIFLEKLDEFIDLKISICEVIKLLSAMQTSSQQNISDFLRFAAALKQDLCSWRSHIFVLQDTNNIHYMDDSIVSSCLQIQTMMVPSSINETEIAFF